MRRTQLKKEVLLAKEAFGKDRSKFYFHLGRAHVLAQSSTLDHLYTHFLMLKYSFLMRDLKEVLGQIVRLLVTIPGHMLGKVPKGNIGWSTVGLTEELPISDDLQSFL